MAAKAAAVERRCAERRRNLRAVGLARQRVCYSPRLPTPRRSQQRLASFGDACHSAAPTLGDYRALTIQLRHQNLPTDRSAAVTVGACEEKLSGFGSQIVCVR